MIGRVREVGIQDKLDRLDEAFLFERSIDIDTYDRHAEKLREELTLARSHSGQLEELDVEGILRSQNAFCRAPPTCGCGRHSSNASGSNSCSFQREFRSAETALFEPPQPHPLSATCGKSRPEMKVWWT